MVYQYCNWNLGEDLVFDEDVDLSFIRFRADDLLPMSRLILWKEEKCRAYEVPTSINTCETGEIAELQVKGKINPYIVESSSKYILISVAPCDYKFIITEVVTNEKESFIEAFSPNCKNTIITQDLKLRLYSGNDTDPKANDSTNMKGKRTDENGFITFCRSSQSTVYINEKCNYVTGNKSPADTSPGGEIDIALFENPNTVLIVDTFGVPGGGNGPLTTVPHRGVRKVGLINQQNPWNPDMWIILDDGISDPGQWIEVSPQSPTTSPPTTSPPTTFPPMGTSPPTTFPPMGTKSPTTPPPVSSPPTTSPPVSSPISPPTTIPPTTSPPTTSYPTYPLSTSLPTTSPLATSPPTTTPPTITLPTTSPPTPQPECAYNPLITEIVQYKGILVYIEVMATAAC